MPCSRRSHQFYNFSQERGRGQPGLFALCCFGSKKTYSPVGVLAAFHWHAMRLGRTKFTAFTEKAKLAAHSNGPVWHSRQSSGSRPRCLEPIQAPRSLTVGRRHSPSFVHLSQTDQLATASLSQPGSCLSAGHCAQ